MMPMLAAVVWYLVFTLAATFLFYVVARLHLWRAYYTKLNRHTPGPQYIDAGDKLLAGVVAWIAALLWPVSVLAYLIHRWYVMRARRRIAYRYANHKIRQLRGVHIDEP